MDLRQQARDERTDFAAFLATLSPEQWEAPTLCAGWRVRDVVAHVISYEELNVRGLVGRFAQGRLLPGRINAIALAEYNTRTPEELLAVLKDHVEPRGLTGAFGGMIALVDGVIHQQDIRRPLGMPRDIPAERLLPVLKGSLTAPLIGGFWRVRGLRLVATDLDWSTGKGPEVRGRAESLLMAIAGRRGVVDELSGAGRQRLAARIAP
jgi:uncharacterized protein (TIGR03083 family)